MTGDEPICQVCQVKRAAVSYSCWRSGRFLDRTFVCLDCAPTYERLTYGGSGTAAKLVSDAALARARMAGIDPGRGCPGCGTALVEILTNAAAGCEMCYREFASDIAAAIESIQGWTAHVGKSPNG